MSNDPIAADDEGSDREPLAPEAMLAGKATDYSALRQQRRNRDAAERRKREAWQKWAIRIALVDVGSLIGTIVDAAVTENWEKIDQRVFLMLIVGVMAPASVYAYLLRIYSSVIRLFGAISQSADAELRRGNPMIDAARWAFFLTLPAATVAGAATSRDQLVGYVAVIGCEALMFVSYWSWLIAAESLRRDSGAIDHRREAADDSSSR